MKVLIVIHSPTWFTELSILGRHIHDSGEHEVVFYFIDYRHWTVESFAEELRTGSISCVLESETRPTWGGASCGSDGDVATAQKLPRLKARLTGMAKGVVRRYGPEELRQCLVEYQALRDAVAKARVLAQAHRPDVVVLGGDNPGYDTAALIRGFVREGLRTVLVSSTMSNGLEEAEVYAGDPRYHVASRTARITATLFPKWVVAHRGLRLLRCPAARVLAMEAMRLAPPRPWAFNSGYADAIAMESEAMIEYYALAGLSRSKMVLTGSPSNDAMASALADCATEREQLYAELGLPPARPMLLTALPPDFLYVNGGRPQCDFQSYAKLVEFWIASLADQGGFNVIVSLHPSVKIETMRHLERPGVRIAVRKTSQLVPLCDLYVASVSSTIRWALACGKPVLNYDVYRYRYTDFVGLNGVLVTEEQAEFVAILRRLACDSDYLAALRRQQEAEAPRWGRLDGNSNRRIVDLLVRASRSRMAAAKASSLARRTLTPA